MCTHKTLAASPFARKMFAQILYPSGRCQIKPFRDAKSVRIIRVFVVGCVFTPEARPPDPNARLAHKLSRTITLGDIDPDDPISKIKLFQPLADYLAENLGEFGIQQGWVVISRDLQEMAGLLNDGTVDVYFDSSFPTLAAQDLSGSEIILRRWKQADPTYCSSYVALRQWVTAVEDFPSRSETS